MHISDFPFSKQHFDKEGFFLTGDIGYYDSQGVIYFIEKIENMIHFWMYEVAPNILEARLLGSMNIIDAAVVGIPHKENGEVVMPAQSKGILFLDSEIKFHILLGAPGLRGSPTWDRRDGRKLNEPHGEQARGNYAVALEPPLRVNVERYSKVYPI